jgi:hypothetical protein
VAIAALLVLAASPNPFDVDTMLLKPRAPAREVMRTLDASGAVANVRSVHVSIPSAAYWELAATVVDQLERRGIEVSVDPNWTYMFGKDHAERGPAETWLYAVGPEGACPALPPDARQVAKALTTTLYASPPPTGDRICR